MYFQFFGMTREPFSLAPDPRYLFMSERHREALAHLLYGVGGNGGFVVLSGAIGAGKTTVCRCFMEQIPKRCSVAYIFNPKLTATELLSSICDEFGASYPLIGMRPSTVKDFLDPLNQFLLASHGVGQKSVLVIDEAQNLSAEVLEQLRLLTNLETNERKLLQIILIGQPELRTMLSRPDLEQLAQRVIARFHLEALSRDETEQYIRHRLSVAGLVGAPPFDVKAMQRIHRLARGVPRRINLLCDRALLGAYAGGKLTVDRHIVETAATEVFGDGVGPATRSSAISAYSWSPALMLAAGVVTGAATLGASLWFNGAIGTRPSGVTTISAIAVGGRPAVPSGAPSAAAGVSVSASPSELVAELSAADLMVSLAATPRDELDAWRELAAVWKLQLAAGPPCPAAQRQQVQCFRSNTSLALIRQLDRPGILTLHESAESAESADGIRRYALLTGLTRQSATLLIGNRPKSVSLAALSTLWRGEFSTFWQVPAGYAGTSASPGSGAFATRLASQLSRLRPAGSTGDPSARGSTLNALVAEFQRSQGLKSDGIAGPTTFMQLNRATGVDEPRLLAAPPAH